MDHSSGKNQSMNVIISLLSVLSRLVFHRDKEKDTHIGKKYTSSFMDKNHTSYKLFKFLQECSTYTPYASITSHANTMRTSLTNTGSICFGVEHLNAIIIKRLHKI